MHNMDDESSLSTLLSNVDLIARDCELQSVKKQFSAAIKQLKLSLIAISEVEADVILPPQTQRLVEYLVDAFRSSVNEVRAAPGSLLDSNASAAVKLSESPTITECCESLIRQIEDIKIKLDKVKSSAPSDSLFEYPELRMIWRESFHDAVRVALDTTTDSVGLLDELHNHIQHAIKDREEIATWSRKVIDLGAPGGAAAALLNNLNREEGQVPVMYVSDLLTKDMLECLLRPHSCRRHPIPQHTISPDGSSSSSPTQFTQSASSPSPPEISTNAANNADFYFEPFQLNRWLNTVRASWIREQGDKWLQWDGRSPASVVITPESANLLVPRRNYQVRTEFSLPQQSPSNSPLPPSILSYVDDANNIVSSPHFLASPPLENVCSEGLQVQFTILAQSNSLLREELQIAKTNPISVKALLQKAQWNGRYKALEEEFVFTAENFTENEDQTEKGKADAEQVHSLKVRFEFRGEFKQSKSASLKYLISPSQSLVHLLVHAALQPEARTACDRSHDQIEKKIQQLKFFESHVPHVSSSGGETVSSLIETLSQLGFLNAGSMVGGQVAQWSQSQSLPVERMEEFLKNHVEDGGANIDLMNVLLQCFTLFIANREVEFSDEGQPEAPPSHSMIMKLGESPDQYFQVFKWYVNMVLQRRYVDAVHWLETEIDSHRSTLTTEQMNSLYAALTAHWTQEKNKLTLCGVKCDFCFHRCLLPSAHEQEHDCCHHIIVPASSVETHQGHDCPARCHCESHKPVPADTIGGPSSTSSSSPSDSNPSACSGRSGHPGVHQCSLCAKEKHTQQQNEELNAKRASDKAQRRAELIRCDAERIVPFGEWSNDGYVRLHPDIKNRPDMKPLQHFVYQEGRGAIALLNDATGLFDKEAYVLLHPDASGGDALKHFAKKGHEKRFPCVVKNEQQIPPSSLMVPWKQQIMNIAIAVREYKKAWTGWISIADNVEKKMQPLVERVLSTFAFNIPPRIPKRVLLPIYDDEFIQQIAGSFNSKRVRPRVANGAADASSSSSTDDLGISIHDLVRARTLVMCKHYQSAHRLILTHDENAEEILPRLFCREVEQLNKVASKMEIEMMSSD